MLWDNFYRDKTALDSDGRIFQCCIESMFLGSKRVDKRKLIFISHPLSHKGTFSQRAFVRFVSSVVVGSCLQLATPLPPCLAGDRTELEWHITTVSVDWRTDSVTSFHNSFNIIQTKVPEVTAVVYYSRLHMYQRRINAPGITIQRGEGKRKIRGRYCDKDVAWRMLL